MIYTRKPDPVEALLYTGDNLKEVQAHMLGFGYVSTQVIPGVIKCINVEDKKVMFVVYAGHYIIFTGRGFVRYSKEFFEERYERMGH